MNINEVSLRGDGRLIPPRRVESTRFTVMFGGNIYPLIPAEPGESRWCEEQFGLSCLYVVNDGQPREGNVSSEYRFTSGYMVYNPRSPLYEGRESLGWGAIRRGNSFFLISPRVVVLEEDEIRFSPSPGFERLDFLGEDIEKTFPIRDMRYTKPQVFVASDRYSDFSEPGWIRIRGGMTMTALSQMPVTMMVQRRVSDLTGWIYQAPIISPEDRHLSGILQAAAAVKALCPELEYSEMIRPGIDVAPLLRRISSEGPGLGSPIDGERNLIIPGLSRGIVDVPLSREIVAKRLGQEMIARGPIHERIRGLWPLTLGFSVTEVAEGLWTAEIARDDLITIYWMQTLQAVYRCLIQKEGFPNGLGMFFDNAVALGGGRLGPWINPVSYGGDNEAGFFIRLGSYRTEIGYLPNIVGWVEQGLSVVGAISRKTENPPPFYSEGITSALVAFRDLDSGALASASIPRGAHRETFFEEDEVNQGFSFHRKMALIRRHQAQGFIPFPTQMGIRGNPIEINTDDQGYWQGERSNEITVFSGEMDADDILVVQDLESSSQGRNWVHRMWSTAGRIGARAMKEGARLTQIELGPTVVSYSRREGKYYSSERLSNEILRRDPLACGLGRRMQYGRVCAGGTVLVLEVADRAPRSTRNWAKLFNAMSLQNTLDCELPFIATGIGRCYGPDAAGLAIHERRFYGTGTLIRMREEQGLECLQTLAGVRVVYNEDSYGVDRFSEEANGALCLETDLPLIVPTATGRISDRIQREIEVSLLIKIALRIGFILPGKVVGSFVDYIEGRIGSTARYLGPGFGTHWWSSARGWVIPRPADKEKLRVQILRAIQVGQRSRLEQFVGQARERTINARTAIVGVIEGREQVLEPPPEQDPFLRDQAIRQLNARWRERQPLWGRCMVSAPRDGSQRVLESFMGTENPGTLILREKAQVENETYRGRFITFDSESTLLRDTADSIKIESNGDVIWEVAITLPKLDPDEVDQVKKLPGSLYALGKSRPMLGPRAGMFSLDEGELRRVRIVKARIGQRIQIEGTSIQNIRIERNLTPRRVTSIERRGEEIQQHFAGVQKAYQNLGMNFHYQVGSFFEGLYYHCWKEISRSVNQFLTEELGAPRQGEFLPYLGPRSQYREVNQFLESHGEEWIDSEVGAETYGRFTAPLRRGEDLENLCGYSIHDFVGVRRRGFLRERFRAISLNNRSEIRLIARGFFFRRNLFYDIARARVIPAPQGPNLKGQIIEIERGFSEKEE